jgi:hypothetical protein
LRSPQVVTALPNIYDAVQVDEFAAASDAAPITDAQAEEIARLYATNYGLPATPAQPATTGARS